MRKETLGVKCFHSGRNRRSLFDEEFGMSTTLSGTADIGGQAKAKADFSSGLDAEAEAFLGAKAQASLSGDIEWDREDDYSSVLKDHFNIFLELGTTSW